jgi:hypothetical protein
MVRPEVKTAKYKAAIPGNAPQAEPTNIAPPKSQKNAKILKSTDNGLENVRSGCHCSPFTAFWSFARRTPQTMPHVHADDHTNNGRTILNELAIVSSNAKLAIAAKQQRRN